MNRKRLLLFALLTLAVGLFFALGLDEYLSLAYLKGQREAIASYYQGHPAAALGAYFLLYVAVTALSLPGATVMTLVGGAVFGFWATLAVVSFASSIGATLAFLVARLLLRDLVRGRFGHSLAAVDRGVEREGAFYLFTLRLVPLFPFFVINLVMGLTPMGTWRFYWVSQLGMLGGTAVYVNAGTQLGRLDSLTGILSPGLLLSFTLLGLFPLVAKRLVERLRSRRVYRGWPRPRRFDRNLVVIGGGAAGLVSAYIAASLKAKVTLIEKGRMGGDCLNSGCVPSKALIRAARAATEARRAGELGVDCGAVTVDFPKVMARVREVVARVAPHDSVERYSALGVECLQGEARITSPWTVEVAGRRLTTRAVVVATGAAPFVPTLPGLEQGGYLTSDTLWSLEELPRRLVVLGGGPIGCELAQAFRRLGSEVTLVQRGPRLLPREDPEVAERLSARFRAEGIGLCLDHAAQAVAGGNELLCEHRGRPLRIGFDRLLVAVGRRAETAGLGLEGLGISLNRDGTIETDPFLRTRFPNILACGDVAGPYQFTHAAAHQAWHATVNALFGHLRRFRVDYGALPWALFTDPEVGRVGLNEQEAQRRGIACEVTRFGLEELDRALAEGDAEGEVKVLTVPGRDRILGATIVGPQAGELISEFAGAIRHGLGLKKLLATVRPYPTRMEANRYLAGEWRRAHTPQRLLGGLEWYLRMRRGG